MIRIVVPADAQPGDTLLLTRGQAEGHWSCKVQPMTHDVAAPPAVAPEDDLARHQRLWSAIMDAGGAWSSKLARGTSPALTVPGVVATEPIAAGEELGSVPSSLFLSAEAVRKKAPELCRAVDALPPQEHTGLPAQVTIMVQLLVAAEERRAAGRAASGCLTVWEAFADVLACETLADHPYRLALRDPKSFRSLLDPSPEAELVERVAWGVLARYEVIVQKVEPAMLGHGFTAERFLRAWLLLVTRAFETGGARTTLVPGMDSFNHRPQRAGVQVYWDADAGTMRVKATRDIARGEEVFISYGDLCNPMLYRTYGFTLPPAEEPGWTCVLMPAAAQHILKAHLPPAHAAKIIEFDSRRLHPTVVGALKAAQSKGRETGDEGEASRALLEELLRFRIAAYLQDVLLKPTRESLERVGDGGESHWASWDVILAGADAARLSAGGAAVTDALRVKASGYLCLAAHLEALDDPVAAGGLPRAAAEGLRNSLRGVFLGGLAV
uniref:SET domain-containing protein n=1 Tax=Alexandrium monilatum TaxID=311494 RepID=A0A7S4V2G5_9DINO